MEVQDASTNTAVAWVLQRIKTDFYFSLDGKGMLIVSASKPFEVHAGEVGAPPYSLQNGILWKLKEWGVIELTETNSDELRDDMPGVEAGEYLKVKPLQPKFDEFYQEYNKSTPLAQINKAVFDQKEHELSLDGRVIKIALGNESVICSKIFSKPIGTKFTEDEVGEKFDEIAKYQVEGKDMHGVVYNAVASINRKIEQKTGIKNLLKCKRGHVWAEVDKS